MVDFEAACLITDFVEKLKKARGWKAPDLLSRVMQGLTEPMSAASLREAMTTPLPSIEEMADKVWKADMRLAGLPEDTTLEQILQMIVEQT